MKTGTKWVIGAFLTLFLALVILLGVAIGLKNKSHYYYLIETGNSSAASSIVVETNNYYGGDYFGDEIQFEHNIPYVNVYYLGEE